jgi:hypothetical protein
MTSKDEMINATRCCLIVNFEYIKILIHELRRYKSYEESPAAPPRDKSANRRKLLRTVSNAVGAIRNPAPQSLFSLFYWRFVCNFHLRPLTVGFGDV